MLTRSMAAQIRLGKRYGKQPNRPCLEKIFGNEVAGSVKVPPITGPMIEPIAQTNGITEYARAAEVSFTYSVIRRLELRVSPHCFYHVMDDLIKKKHPRSCSGFVTNSPTTV